MDKNEDTDKVMQVGNLIGESHYKNPHRGRLYSSEGILPALNCNEGGQREVKVVEKRGYKIRKLTPRECFRLMGVDEQDIDTLLSAGIADSNLYKLAGNSIVVDVLYWLFYKLLISIENESQQLTLF